MESTTRTLGSPTTSSTPVRTRLNLEERSTVGFNVYVSVFSQNVVNRYPDISNLECITYDDIERIAEFSALCVPVVLETWERILQDRTRGHRGEKAA